jgi:hypothetical protein
MIRGGYIIRQERDPSHSISNYYRTIIELSSKQNILRDGSLAAFGVIASAIPNSKQLLPNSRPQNNKLCKFVLQ